MLYPSRLVPMDIPYLLDWQLVAAAYHLLGAYYEDEAGYEIINDQLWYIGSQGKADLSFNSDFNYKNPTECLQFYGLLVTAENWQEEIRLLLQKRLDPLMYISATNEEVL